MIHRGASLSSIAIVVAGVAGLGLAALAATGVTPCSILKSAACSTGSTAVEGAALVADAGSREKPAEAVTVAETTQNKKAGSCDKPAEATTVAQTKTESCESACDKPAEAVAVADTKTCDKSGEAKVVNAANVEACESACDKGEAKVVAASNTESCAASCAEGEAAVVNASNVEACEAACDKGAKAVAASDTETCAAACDKAQAVAASDTATCAEGKAAVVAAGFSNDKCVYSGNDVNPEVTTAYNGMDVGFCCPMCKGKFEKAADADKRAALVSVVKPVNDGCCDKQTDAATFEVYMGVPVAFCGDKCQNWFHDAEPAKRNAMLARHVKPVNDTCPMSGKPIDAKAVAFHNGVGVAFCGPGCASHFEKAADETKAKMVAKATEGMDKAPKATPAANVEPCDDACKKACGEDCVNA